MAILSVVMIAKNEEACIAQCLESVRDIAGEIVVGDTGSSDATREIAAGFGARVVEVPWQDDFAAARNAVLALATGQWLLHMDADEALDPEGAARIRDVVDHDGYGSDAIELCLANYCNDPRAWRWVPAPLNSPHAQGHAGYIQTELLRLFRNGLGFEYREAVHENITESVLERGAKIRREDILIHHYGYGKQADGGRDKGAFYLGLARKKREARPNDPKALHDFAEQALACGLGEEAEQACREAAALDPLHLPSATTLANILLNRGDFDEAQAVLAGLEAADISPPHVVCALGAIACRAGRFDEAQRRFDAVLAESPKSPMARLWRARLLDRLGEARRARGELKLLCDLAPGIGEFEKRLQAHDLRLQGEEVYVAGLHPQALECLVEALRLDPEDPITHNDLGVLLHAMGKLDKARARFESALELAPGMAEAGENLRGLSE